MNRFILILLVSLSAVIPIRAQYYFGMQTGLQTTFRIYDKQGDLKGYYYETVKSINGKLPDSVTVCFEHIYFDKDGNYLLKDKSSNWSIDITDGKVAVKLETIKKGMVTQDLMVKGCVIYIPPDIKEGDKLPDKSLSIKVGKVGGTIRLTERKVLGMESVTVPVGTFKAAKVQEKQKTKVAIVAEEVTIISWLVKDIGCVRQESYDSKGQLVQTIEMVKK